MPLPQLAADYKTPASLVGENVRPEEEHQQQSSGEGNFNFLWRIINTTVGAVQRCVVAARGIIPTLVPGFGLWSQYAI